MSDDSRPHDQPDPKLIPYTRQIDPEHAELLINKAGCESVIEFKIIPGANVPEGKISVAPHITIRMFEREETEDDEYLFVTGLPYSAPRNFFVDKAVVFSGDVYEMVDVVVGQLDDALSGVKDITNISTTEEYKGVEAYLKELGAMFEESRFYRKPA